MSLSDIRFRATLRGTVQRTIRNYNELVNKPAINGHTLIGNQSGHALGLANEDDIINVEANPLGSATADLHKILVDDTIYSIPDVVVYGTASGAIASFDDGGNDKPLKSLKVAINPVQASGTPTPQAPIPIYGWTGANIQRTGKNLLNKNNVTFASGSYDENGNPISNPSIKHTSNYEEIKPNTTYTLSGTIYDASVAVRIFYFDKNQNWLGRTEPYRTNEITFTTPNNCKYYQLQCSANISSVDDWQLENGSSASQYEPYNGTTYPITWSEAGEVYRGTLDVTNSKLKARPYYARYNGETLIGPWISSMDVYDPNTPPTTGAQVVDLGGVETEIDISPTQITTLLGNNNIWSDTGEIEECVYQRDLNIVINQFDVRITALEQAMASLSGTRSLSLSKSAPIEEPKEEETKNEI